MSLKTTMFQENPFNSFRGESLTKTLPTDSRTGHVDVHSDREFLSDYFPRSYAPLNLENSQYLLLSL
jgi:hypothetical protein